MIEKSTEFIFPSPFTSETIVVEITGAVAVGDDEEDEPPPPAEPPPEAGGAAGVTAPLIADTELVPMAFVAVTVNVYAVPFVRPVTVIGDAPPVAEKPPTVEVTVYAVIEEPPSLLGDVNAMVACPSPPVTVPIVGASGAVAGPDEEAVNDWLACDESDPKFTRIWNQ